MHENPSKHKKKGGRGSALSLSHGPLAGKLRRTVSHHVPFRSQRNCVSSADAARHSNRLSEFNRIDNKHVEFSVKAHVTTRRGLFS